MDVVSLSPPSTPPSTPPPAVTPTSRARDGAPGDEGTDTTGFDALLAALLPRGARPGGPPSPVTDAPVVGQVDDGEPEDDGEPSAEESAVPAGDVMATVAWLPVPTAPTTTASGPGAEPPGLFGRAGVAHAVETALAADPLAGEPTAPTQDPAPDAPASAADPATSATPEPPAPADDRSAAAATTAPTAPTTAAPNAPPTSVPSTAPVTAPPAPVAPARTAASGHPAPVSHQLFETVSRLATAGHGVHRITVRLDPGTLGEVRVHLTVRDGEFRVRLGAGEAGRTALREGAPELQRLLEGARAGQPGSQASQQVRVDVHALDRAASHTAHHVPPAETADAVAATASTAQSGLGTGLDSGAPGGHPGHHDQLGTHPGSEWTGQQAGHPGAAAGTRRALTAMDGDQEGDPGPTSARPGASGPLCGVDVRM